MAKPVVRNTRRVLADAVTFVRAQEVNRAISTVTFEQLAQEAIARNGRAENDVGYSEYRVPDKDAPASRRPVSDPVGTTGTFTTAVPKRSRIVALQAALNATIELLKSFDPAELEDPEEASETAGDTL